MSAAVPALVHVGRARLGPAGEAGGWEGPHRVPSWTLWDSCAHGMCYAGACIMLQQYTQRSSSSHTHRASSHSSFIKVHPSSHLSQGHRHHCGRQWEHEGPADDHCQTHHRHHFRYSGGKRFCEHYCGEYVLFPVQSCLPCASYQSLSPLSKLQTLRWHDNA